MINEILLLLLINIYYLLFRNNFFFTRVKRFPTFLFNTKKKKK